MMWLPGRWEAVPKDKEEPRNIFQKPSPSVQVQITAGQAGRDGSLTREGWRRMTEREVHD